MEYLLFRIETLSIKPLKNNVKSILSGLDTNLSIFFFLTVSINFFFFL